MVFETSYRQEHHHPPAYLMLPRGTALSGGGEQNAAEVKGEAGQHKARSRKGATAGMNIHRALGRIRTPDLWNRNPTLYPTELQARDAM